MTTTTLAAYYEVAWKKGDDIRPEDRCPSCVPPLGATEDGYEVVGKGRRPIESARASGPAEGVQCDRCGATLVPPLCTGTEAYPDGCDMRADECICQELRDADDHERWDPRHGSFRDEDGHII